MSEQIPVSIIACLAMHVLNGIKGNPLYWDLVADQRERDAVCRTVRCGLTEIEKSGQWRLVPREPTPAMHCTVEPGTCGEGEDHWSSPDMTWPQMWDAAPSALLPIPEDHKYDR